MSKEIFGPQRNFLGLDARSSDPAKSRVTVLPVPYDGTCTYGSGARNGPQAIIDASRNVELYDEELDSEPYRVGIHTLPELLPLANPEDVIESVRTVVAQQLRRRKFVMTLGGEHSISIGAVKAHLGKFPSMTVLQLDAHADLRQEYLGTHFSHACAARRIRELCPITQVGIRSFSIEEKQEVKAQKQMFFSTLTLRRTQDWPTKVISTLSREVYVTVDLDVFDPSEMPATGTPEPGGLNWHEVLELLRRVSLERKVVGCDIVELAPIPGFNAPNFLAARLAYKLIAYAVRPRKD